MVECGLNTYHMMITEFTNKHKIDANDIVKHLSRLYDRIDHLQVQEDDGWGEKRKLAFTGFYPYDAGYSDDEEYEYNSGKDVYKGNFKSFKAKEVEKIKAKGVASLFNRKIKKWCCPYCTTKPKPKDGRFDHLVSHVEDVANRGEDYMIRGQHVALAKALTPV
ncbi:PAX-interacting protein 1 [Hordeum vulgare]|nr:PAX-interacting protein 1 [Hordeum vulgare]